MTERKTGGTKNLIYSSVVLVILIIIIMMISRQDLVQKKTEPAEQEMVLLWNQKDLDNWMFYLKESTADPLNVFTIKDSLVHILGTPYGYMKTKDIYKEYSLHVEWRWPEEPGNSGVFLHMQEQDTIWPGLIECQLMSGNAGDLVFLGGTDASERLDKSNLVLKKSGESSEKTPGQWNTYDIISRNDSIIVYVNGIFKNTITSPSVNEGHIGLQSEGAPVEFRNVYLVQIHH
jgi:hypothetical protein